MALNNSRFVRMTKPMVNMPKEYSVSIIDTQHFISTQHQYSALQALPGLKEGWGGENTDKK